jgi:hypothetical protein
MRLIAAIMTLVALAASGLAGQKLHETLNAPDAELAGVELARADLSEPQPPMPPTPPRRWPALFGEVQPPAPPAPEPVAEPQPPVPVAEPQPPRPPIESLGYQVKGVVRLDQSIWAMVSHPTGEKLLRVGDMLTDDVEIMRIDEAGIWVDYGADEPVLLGFIKD